MCGCYIIFQWWKLEHKLIKRSETGPKPQHEPEWFWCCCWPSEAGEVFISWLGVNRLSFFQSHISFQKFSMYFFLFSQVFRKVLEINIKHPLSVHLALFCVCCRGKNKILKQGNKPVKTLLPSIKEESEIRKASTVSNMIFPITLWVIYSYSYEI